jgi:hypothetical protein
MDVEKQKPYLFDIEKHRLVYFIKDEAEAKYKKLKRTESECKEILYAGDFRPLANRGSNNGNLELMLPSEIFATVDYLTIYRSLLSVFDLDRDSNDFESGTGTELPDMETKNIGRFKKEHPDTRLKTEYMYFGLVAPEDERRIIIRTRYFDPVTNEPLSEVWEAVKNKLN